MKSLQKDIAKLGTLLKEAQSLLDESGKMLEGSDDNHFYKLQDELYADERALAKFAGDPDDYTPLFEEMAAIGDDLSEKACIAEEIESNREDVLYTLEGTIENLKENLRWLRRSMKQGKRIFK